MIQLSPADALPAADDAKALDRKHLRPGAIRRPACTTTVPCPPTAPQPADNIPAVGKKKLPPIPVTDQCNYIAAFLTFCCPFTCAYCINDFESRRRRPEKRLSAAQWVQGLDRLANLDRDSGPIPVTLQGGEPSAHPEFYQILTNLPDRIRLDLLTNLAFDVDEMIRRVHPDRLRRQAPYASIRVSYHPSQMPLDTVLTKTLRLLDAGFHVGIWAVDHPEISTHVRQAQAIATEKGIDFRLKEFLGRYDNRLYGNYRYPGACDLDRAERVRCRTTELLIAPDGHIFRCHHDLYERAEPIGHLLDLKFRMDNDFRACACFGHCNPCDVKIKTNRFQQFGHTSVEIIRE